MTDGFSRMLDQDQTDRARRLVAFFHHPDRDERHKALGQLVGMGSAAVPALIEALSDPEARVRQGALRGLTQIASPTAIPALMEYLEARATEIGNNRAFAMQALSASIGPHIEDRKGAFAYLQRQLRDPDLFIRAYAFEALGKLGDPRATPLIEKALRDKEPFIAEKAAEALAELAHTSQEAPFEEDLLSPDELSFALQSGDASRRQMGMNELVRRASEGQDMLRLVTRLLLGPNRIGRQSALEAAAALRDERLLPTMIQIIDNDQAETDLRSRALRALAAYGPQRCENALAESQRANLQRTIRGLLSRKDLFLRSGAVAALGALPGDESLKLLLRASHDQNAWIRDDATRALIPHAGPNLAPYLPQLGRLAIHALSHMETTGLGNDGGGSPQELARFQERLVQALIDTLPHRRGSVPEEVLEAGFAALRAKGAAVRVNGLELLDAVARAGHRPRLSGAQVKDLSGALSSKREPIVAMTLDLLDAWLPRGSAKATVNLIGLLQRGHEGLALRAIALLGRAGDIEAREVLRALSTNDNPNIAGEARAALDNLGIQ